MNLFHYRLLFLKDAFSHSGSCTHYLWEMLHSFGYSQAGVNYFEPIGEKRRVDCDCNWFMFSETLVFKYEHKSTGKKDICIDLFLYKRYVNL